MSENSKGQINANHVSLSWKQPKITQRHKGWLCLLSGNDDSSVVPAVCWSVVDALRRKCTVKAKPTSKNNCMAQLWPRWLRVDARGTRKSSTKSLQLELQISSGQGWAVHGDLAGNDPLDHPTRIFNFNSPNPLNTWQKKIVEIKVYQSLEGSSCTGKVGGHSCVEKNAAPGTTASIAEKRRCQKILAV